MILQLLINGLVMGCAYALVALGFGLIYSTTRIFHFAHGAIYTLAAYVFYTLYLPLKLHVLLAALLTIGVAAVVGLLSDELIYRPLTDRGAFITPLLSSIGLYTLILNFITLIYGNETKILNFDALTTYRFFGVILTRLQIIILLTFACLLLFSFVILKHTKLGITVRATHDNPLLVSAVGMNIRQVRRVVFALGSGLAATSAILLSLDISIDPNIGMPAFLVAAVAVIIGGVEHYRGAVLGAILLGILQSIIVWKFSARWVDAIAFIILIVFLIYRPEGIYGRRRRIEEAIT